MKVAQMASDVRPHPSLVEVKRGGWRRHSPSSNAQSMVRVPVAQLQGWGGGAVGRWDGGMVRR